MKTLTFFLAAILFATPAFAQEKTVTVTKPETTAYRFAPDFCDMEVTFPEKPAIARKCIAGSGCYEVNSYTMVYDLQTTVDVSVTCNPSTPAAFEKYTQAAMKAALAGMIDERNLATHEVRFDQYEKMKSAALTGTGKTGQSDKIYTAQLWIGPNSVFTIQAELIGAAHDVADRSFRDILQSIKMKEGKQAERPKTAPNLPREKNQ